MSEYIPFIVIGVSAIALYFGTIIWTERIFIENKKSPPKQEEIPFPESKPKARDLVSTH